MRRFIKEPKGKAAQIWEIVVAKNTVSIMHGQLGGKMQDTLQEFEGKNLSKKNEKSPEQVAQEWAENQIKKKVKQGYFEVNISTGKPIGDKAAGDILTYVQPPTNFTIYKPQHSLSKALEKALRGGQALVGRKRDGYMHYLVTDEHGYTRLFSSKWEPAHNLEMKEMVPWMERYPHIERDVQRLGLPPMSIVVGELCASPECGRDSSGFTIDDFEYVGGVIKSLTPRALDMQQEQGRLEFCIWDIAIWGGEPYAKEMTVGARYDHIYHLIGRTGVEFITMPELIELYNDGFKVTSHRAGELELEYDHEDVVHDLLEYAKNLGWEGYVVVNPHEKYGDKAFNFRGKNDRPVCCGKLKPDYEADFVVMWDPDNKIGEWGTGKNKKGVGSVQAYLYDDNLCELVPVSKVGGGITDEQCKKFADPKLYPMVWQVVFKGWTAKGSLRHPSLFRVRDDKKPEECSIAQNPRWRGAEQ